MTSAKGWLLARFGRVVMRQAWVAGVTPVGPRFRQVDVEGPALRSAGWRPGDKAQVLVPGEEVRTYTPMSWDEAGGATRFLVLLRDGSPGSSWGRAVAVGDSLGFVGPQRSLVPGDGPVVLFGDETSFAVAHALRSTRSTPVSAVFEVAEPGFREVIDGLGAGDAPLVERAAGDTHLDAVTDALIEALARHPSATLALTGRAQSIQGLRARLKARGVGATQKVKAYWSEGKRGLD